MVDEIKTQDKLDEAVSMKKLAVVYFFATSSEPCKEISPIVENFSQQFESIEFI